MHASRAVSVSVSVVTSGVDDQHSHPRVSLSASNFFYLNRMKHVLGVHVHVPEDMASHVGGDDPNSHPGGVAPVATGMTLALEGLRVRTKVETSNHGSAAASCFIFIGRSSDKA